MKHLVGLLGLVAAALAAAALSGVAGGEEPPHPPIVVASKPFPESRLLGEMFAQLLEREGIVVERKLALGATAVLMEGLKSGAVDVYPEYTGTGLMAVLNDPPDSDPDRVWKRVRHEFQVRWKLHWMEPLGFENTYAIAVRQQTAAKYGLQTISDLAREGRRLVGGFSPDFKGRDDGLPGLAEAYGLKLREARAMDPALKYRALADGAVDVVDGYSTDGELAALNLVVLQDDKRFFPPYHACALLSARLARSQSLLQPLVGKIDAERMRRWNAALSGGTRTVESLARDALAELVPERSPEPAQAERSFLAANLGRLLTHLGEHVLLVLISLLLSCVVAIPLGVWIERAGGAAEYVVSGTGLLQTIPSLALLALLIPLMGIGAGPAITALFLYALFPIVRATYTGVRDAAPAAAAAAEAIGMTPAQVLKHVRLPLAAPFIMSGVRTAAVITVGTATLATFIGAGGLGEPIQEGLSMLDNRLILLGAIPAALLALAVDGALALVERAVHPKTASG
ncbi:MAG: glycine betaine ABC transporter substrate-binding protein [Planctomycetota bacterium]